MRCSEKMTRRLSLLWIFFHIRFSLGARALIYLGRFHWVGAFEGVFVEGTTYYAKVNPKRHELVIFLQPDRHSYEYLSRDQSMKRCGGRLYGGVVPYKCFVHERGHSDNHSHLHMVIYITKVTHRWRPLTFELLKQ